MKAILHKNRRRTRRLQSLKAKLARTSARPRLAVRRSVKHISAQVIDPRTGHCLVTVSSTGKAFAAELGGKTKTERAAVIGREVARRAIDAGIKEVVFDRGYARFHGRVKALAEAAREGGLKF